ncbi:MAG: WecB/TagA/CpsF family glycosyltransferase [Candidatus Omnitrophica bacterium]|nr:WecB/TagA/CpsF family glycosyltransferase [Candidatus Omnitrophota bacterium]
MNKKRNHCYLHGMRIDRTSYEETAQLTVSLAKKNKSAFICVAAVHVLYEAYSDPKYKKIVNSADIVTPDGMSLLIALKLLGVRGASRVAGAYLLPKICQAAQTEGVSVGFYGASQETINLLTQKIKADYPDLTIAYAYSPPYRALSEEEDQAVVNDIKSSKVQILFVGIGCPKQERWVASHRQQLNISMVSIGAAFDIVAGVKSHAPLLMQRFALEWLYRLFQEPRRLWKRYLISNLIFCKLLIAELFRFYLIEDYKD